MEDLFEQLENALDAAQDVYGESFTLDTSLTVFTDIMDQELSDLSVNNSLDSGARLWPCGIPISLDDLLNRVSLFAPFSRTTVAQALHVT